MNPVTWQPPLAQGWSTQVWRAGEGRGLSFQGKSKTLSDTWLAEQQEQKTALLRRGTEQWGPTPPGTGGSCLGALGARGPRPLPLPISPAYCPPAAAAQPHVSNAAAPDPQVEGRHRSGQGLACGLTGSARALVLSAGGGAGGKKTIPRRALVKVNQATDFALGEIRGPPGEGGTYILKPACRSLNLYALPTNLTGVHGG